jgi:hypothetical protein
MHALAPLHVAAGALAIAIGAVALYAAKGSKLHRRSGMLFVWVMLAMSITGALMAAAAGGPWAAVNTPAGVLTSLPCSSRCCIGCGASASNGRSAASSASPLQRTLERSAPTQKAEKQDLCPE